MAAAPLHDDGRLSVQEHLVATAANELGWSLWTTPQGKTHTRYHKNANWKRRLIGGVKPPHSSVEVRRLLFNIRHCTVLE